MRMDQKQKMNKRKWLSLLFATPVITVAPIALNSCSNQQQQQVKQKIYFYYTDSMECLKYIAYDMDNNKLIEYIYPQNTQLRLNTQKCQQLVQLQNENKYEFYFVNYTNQYSKLGLLDFMAKYEKELKLYD